jgi:hypothetical protein
MRNWLLLSAAMLCIGSPGASAAAKAAATQAVQLGSLTGQLPAGWKSQPPAGPSRLAQYVVPQAAGDTMPALLIVFYFGKGQGGATEDNVRRWMGMMRSPDGGEIGAAAKRGKIEGKGLAITTLDISGTYMDRPFPMAPEATPRPNSRMLAAVIETTGPAGDGPYFLRLVGPAKSVTAAKPGWDAFLASLKVK